MLRTRASKAQSAMEYLMTYGWAILIIAVVLGALFSLGVFSGGNLLGTSCVSSPGYLCSNPSLATTGQLSFTFGQNLGITIYNLEMACAATSNSAGLPNFASPYNGWDVIGGNTATLGTALPTNGVTQLAANALVANGLTMVPGQTQVVTGLLCYGSTGVPIAIPSSAAAVGTSFSGYIWVNYTTSASACTAGQCTGGSWDTVKALTVTLKVV